MSSTFGNVHLLSYYRYSTAVGAVFEELQKTYLVVSCQLGNQLCTVLEVQKIMAHWLHMRQQGTCVGPQLKGMSISMEV